MSQRVGATPRYGRSDHLAAELRARADHHQRDGRPGWADAALEAARQLEDGADRVWFGYRYWIVPRTGTMRKIQRGRLIAELERVAEVQELGERPWESVPYRMAAAELRDGATRLRFSTMSYTIVEDGDDEGYPGCCTGAGRACVHCDNGRCAECAWCVRAGA